MEPTSADRRLAIIMCAVIAICCLVANVALTMNGVALYLLVSHSFMTVGVVIAIMSVFRRPKRR
jgi:hypothetical protein